jgi:2-dehydropantoate 2-reductase
MNVLCLGAGAIGGYFLGRVVEAGAGNVTFLVRERRKAELDRDGLVVESVHGNFKLPVKAITADALSGPYDLVVVSCKAYDLDSAITAIRPAVGARTVVLPLLNGLAHLEPLNAAFGKAQVLGGFASLAITMDPGGCIRHLNDWHTIMFGEQDGGGSDRVAVIEAMFRRTKLGTAASGVPDIRQKMWEKLVLLATLAGATTLMRAAIGDIVKAPGGREMMLELLGCNAEIAARSGHPVPEAAMASNRQLFSNAGLPMTASMLRDIEGGGRIEADHIVGFMLGEARRLGVNDRLLALCFMHLKAYESRRKREPKPT